jgi:hypothetical protein
MEYNDENLLELWAENLSHSQIALQLGVSKGVAAGRLRRLRKDKTKVDEVGKWAALRALKEESEKEEADKRVKAKAKFKPKKRRLGNSVFYNLPKKNYTKSELYDMLREAVENTK